MNDERGRTENSELKVTVFPSNMTQALLHILSMFQHAILVSFINVAC